MNRNIKISSQVKTSHFSLYVFNCAAQGTYGRKRNRLYHVNDEVVSTAYPDDHLVVRMYDIDDQGTFDPEAINQNNNYRYDELGRLIFDAQENIADIEWRHDDKIALILKSDTGGGIEFTYDPSGNRISKGVFTGPQFDPIYIDYYIRDAQGNVLATYRRHFDHDFGQSHYTVSERAIYGSDRMGVYAYNDTVYPLPPMWTDDFRPVHTGHKKYELKNHLGNVMAVVHGRKQAVQGTGSTISHYTAIPAFSGDYSAFGVRLRGRGNGDYRWGFGSHENDDEVSGEGNHLSFGDYGYNPRLGRRWIPDPIIKHHESTYATFANNPVWFVDPFGTDTVEVSAGSGEFMSHKKAEGDDVFFTIGEDGRRANQISLDPGTLQGINRPKVNVQKRDGSVEEKQLTLFDIKGDDNAKRLFEFFADPDNTKVEWTHAKVGKGESGRNIVGTQNDPSATAVGHYLLITDYTLREAIHNHPKGTPPSGEVGGKYGDIPNAALYHERNGNTILKVYTHPDNYIRYDSSGILEE